MRLALEYPTRRPTKYDQRSDGRAMLLLARLGATWSKGEAGLDEEGCAAALTAKGILSAAGSRSSRHLQYISVIS